MGWGWGDVVQSDALCRVAYAHDGVGRAISVCAHHVMRAMNAQDTHCMYVAVSDHLQRHHFLASFSHHDGGPNTSEGR